MLTAEQARARYPKKDWRNDFEAALDAALRDGVYCILFDTRCVSQFTRREMLETLSNLGYHIDFKDHEWHISW